MHLQCVLAKTRVVEQNFPRDHSEGESEWLAVSTRGIRHR